LQKNAGIGLGAALVAAVSRATERAGPRHRIWPAGQSGL